MVVDGRFAPDEAVAAGIGAVGEAVRRLEPAAAEVRQSDKPSDDDGLVQFQRSSFARGNSSMPPMLGPGACGGAERRIQKTFIAIRWLTERPSTSQLDRQSLTSSTSHLAMGQVAAKWPRQRVDEAGLPRRRRRQLGAGVEPLEQQEFGAVGFGLEAARRPLAGLAADLVAPWPRPASPPPAAPCPTADAPPSGGTSRAVSLSKPYMPAPRYTLPGVSRNQKPGRSQPRCRRARTRGRDGPCRAACPWRSGCRG